MDVFEEKLNALLVDTFRIILKVEEQAIRKANKVSLSISELHLLETIGKEASPKTASQIAAELDLTLPSVTVGVNKLLKKGLIRKEQSPEDRRAVRISLTKQGEKMNKYHQLFHAKMVRAVSLELSQQEKEAMIHGIEKLYQFFHKKADSEAAHEL